MTLANSAASARGSVSTGGLTPRHSPVQSGGHAALRSDWAR